MDRSFNSSLLVKSPFSPRQGASSKSALPYSFRKSSRFSVSGKSTQSIQILLSTPFNYVERFGEALPVLITEALTFADKNTVVSARISRHGYAWVVCGRRLLIWQYKQSVNKKALGQCFELQLPQSDLAHRAELVSVFINRASNTPSCIAVSPEGVVRYWPAIIHEGVSVEQQVSLQGQECDSLTDIEGFGCILATTTCTILLIQPQVNPGRHGLSLKMLKIPTGWLGGISRRMSSLFFGPISSENTAESGIVRVLSIPSQSESWSVYVLADHNLQKWSISKEGESLLYLIGLNRMVRDSFQSTLWDNCIGDQTEIDTWLIDIQADKDNIIILAAAVNIPVSPRIYYAMISLQTGGLEPPTHIKDFLLLKISDLYREYSNDALLYRFILCGSVAYVYNQKNVTVIKPQEEPDTLEFNTPLDLILAGSVCVNTPIFFSRTHGLVAVFGNDTGNDMGLNTTSTTLAGDISIGDNSMVVNNLSIYNMDPDEVTNDCKDTLSQLKAAFIFYIKNQEEAYTSIIQEIFPAEAGKVPGIDSLLDKMVVMLCKDLLNDIPAGDPRWTKDANPGIGSSYSMQVVHQLEDKQKALSLFVKFLKDSALLDELAVSTIRTGTMCTIYIIEELFEKVITAIALKSLSHKKILIKVIENLLSGSKRHISESLTSQDIFFTEITKIDRSIQELINYCDGIAHSNASQKEILEVISETCEIISAVFKEINQFREHNLVNFQPTETVKAIAPDFLPWTAANGSDGLFNNLSQLHYLVYKYGIIVTNNERLRSDLLDYLVTLTDILLDSRRSHLESIKGTPLEDSMYRQYCTDRQKFMKPFLQEKEWERCAKLAEKYLDFDTLMVICETTGNRVRLDQYLERFANEGFSNHVYNWFVKENKQGKLLEMCKNKTTSTQKLTNFVLDNPSLSWMQEIFDKKYQKAACTLFNLGMGETESLTRQKTMFSMSKLAGILADNDDSKTINSRLELIAYQEEIPDYVLQEFGYDTDHIRVIPTKDIINLFICSEYKEAAEPEFKKALDLLQFIDEDELREELTLKIWRSAILRDYWDHSNLDSPLEIIQNKLIFRLVDFILADRNSLPPLNILLDDDSLKELQTSDSFNFLIKTGYEHIHRTVF